MTPGLDLCSKSGLTKEVSPRSKFPFVKGDFRPRVGFKGIREEGLKG